MVGTKWQRVSFRILELGTLFAVTAEAIHAAPFITDVSLNVTAFVKEFE